MKDMNGFEIQIGDEIVFATRQGNSSSLRHGHVSDLKETQHSYMAGGEMKHYVITKLWYKNSKTGKVTEIAADSDRIMVLWETH